MPLIAAAVVLMILVMVHHIGDSITVTIGHVESISVEVSATRTVVVVIQQVYTLLFSFLGTWLFFSETQ